MGGLEKENLAFGAAFIGEGRTEVVFYQVYVERASARLGLSARREIVSGTSCLMVDGPGRSAAILFQSVNAVTQMVNADSWFKNVCLPLSPKVPWHAFLCYDIDAYNADVTKFHEGDWDRLRRSLATAAESVSDLAARADIEDVMLGDYEGVLHFLGLSPDTPMPAGSKGKNKMRQLFRMVARGCAYHEGDRARPLVEALDMDVVRCNAPAGVDFERIDKLLETLA